MAVTNPELGQIRDHDEARIFADAEIPNRETAGRTRKMARRVELNGGKILCM